LSLLLFIPLSSNSFGFVEEKKNEDHAWRHYLLLHVLTHRKSIHTSPKAFAIAAANATDEGISLLKSCIKGKYQKYSIAKKFMEHLYTRYGCKDESQLYGWAKDKELIS